MLNSLTVFLAFLAFLLFGYASLLRLLAKRHLPPEQGFFAGLTRGAVNRQALANLGSSAFFVSLPATALLLFWGWGPALIWLTVFHFFVESLCHLQYSIQTSGSTIADHMLRSDKGLAAVLEQSLIQVFFLLAMATVVALVATLIDRQPGLLFALLFLLPARRLISHPSPAIPKVFRVLGTIALLALGLAFSDQMGISVYGDWAPFAPALPWLEFNMPTLIAAILVVSVFQLETNQGFKQDLSLFAGMIIVALVLAMVVKLAWLRPLLDAPLNSGAVASENLPKLLYLCLFVFAGFTAFLVRLLNEEENQETSATVDNATQYGRLQIGSLIHTSYMALLVISLAAALGIGAWKTHFIQWSYGLNILDYLNLAISSNLDLIYADASSGAVLHTILLAALCFTGFSFLLMCANQLTLEEPEKETVLSLIVQAKVPQALGIFVASAYFIGNGISINAWLLIGLLGWVLFCHLQIGLCLESERGALFVIITLFVLLAGTMQTAILTVFWLMSGGYLLVAASIGVLTTAFTLWRDDIKVLIKKLKREEKADFL